jgi:ABC-type branched-subunit amino acid transport system substrate-binding protein
MPRAPAAAARTAQAESPKEGQELVDDAAGASRNEVNMDAAIREITSLLALWLPLGIRWRKDDPIERNAACYANSRRLLGYLRHRLWRRPFSALPARAVEPIRIGFGMALTGPLAPNGKSALLAMKIWQEDVNAKGGVLGRPVELVHYDDQSN